jgi:putative ABC transport system permease protein
MTRASRFSTSGLLARHLSSRFAGSAVLGILVAFAVGGLASLPHALTSLADDELRYEIGSLEPLRVDVNASGSLGAQTTSATTAAGIFGTTDEAVRGIPRSVPSPLGDLMGTANWIAEFRPASITPPEPLAGISPEVRLTVDLGAADRVRYVAGVAPSAWTGDADTPTAADAPIDIAVSQRAATTLALSVGDELSSPYGTLRVSGVFEPRDPTDEFWAHADDLLNPVVIRSPGSPDTVITSALIDPVSTRGLATALAESELRVWYTTVQAKLEYAQTSEVLQQIRQLSTVGMGLPNQQRLAFRTGLTDAISHVIEHVSTLTALLALAGSAPLGVVLAALVLGIRAVVLKRQPALDLVIARGASTLDARRVMAIEGSLIAAPAAILGIAGAAVLVGMQPDAIVAPLLLAAAVPLVFAITVRVSAGRPQRSDLQSRARSRGRWIIEVLIVGLAAVAYLLLSRRGLASSSTVGIDPLLATTPLLLSLAVCVAVLRVYPLPLLAYHRWARGRRSAVGLLGSARAIREPAIGLVSVVAMLVGVSTAVCSLVLAATVTTGLDTNARTQVGADARVDARAITDAALTDLRAVPGVTAAAPIEYVPTTEVRSASRLSVTLIIADTAALHAVRPDLPVLTGDAQLSVLVSADLADQVADSVTVSGQPGVLRGFAAADALPGVAGNWVLIDADFANTVLGSPFEPTSVLLSTNGASSDALTHALPDGGALTERSAVLAESAARPSVTGLRAALAGAIALSALMAAITVALGAVASAPARNRLMSVGHILGMSRRQLRSVVAWEIGPVAVTSIVAGVGLGVILPLFVLRVVDLRALIGGTSPVAVTIPWLVIAAGAIGFAAVVALAGAISIGVARRVDPARQVRMGAE